MTNAAPHRQRPIRGSLAPATALGLALLSVSCAFDDTGLADKTACVTTAECIGSRVCLAGECVDPGDSDAAGPDSDDEDADVPDGGPDTELDGGGEAGQCPGRENACGGCQVLSAEPGTPCGGGDCGDGEWACATANTVACQGASGTLNACGGCGPLGAEPGTPCGTCGELACDEGGDALRCIDPVNSCGTCTALDGEPGTACGGCGDGLWQCRDEGLTVVCAGAGSGNACGGCEPLTHAPGTDCSAICGSGIWECASSDSVRCQSASGDLNSCGGCAPLANEPGTVCGDCGEYQCDSDGEGTSCTNPARNACGGCGPLEATPAALCGICGDGSWTCNLEGTAVACIGATGLNLCDGCGALAADPGTECGLCADGLWTCNDGGTQVFCIGTGDTNACSGCTVLDVEPDTPCGSCGADVFVCVGFEATECAGDTTNACGGCEALPNVPETACGSCGLDTYLCADADTVVCSGDTANACSGCSSLTNPPETPCGPCGLDVYECAGPDAVECSGDTLGNSCGGCDGLPADEGEVCSCAGLGQAEWSCLGTEDLICSDNDNQLLESRDLGAVNEEDEVTVEGWFDYDDDFDLYRADVVSDNSGRTIAVKAQATLLPGSGIPPQLGICAFYEYNDSRAGNLVPYACGAAECVYFDRSALMLVSADCLTEAGEFDPDDDLYGCCSSVGADAANVLLSEIDRGGTAFDDTGSAFVFVLAEHEFGSTTCASYSLSVTIAP